MFESLQLRPAASRAARFSSHTRAVIVGVSEYRSAKLKPLPACTREARALSETLTDPTGCAIPDDHVRCLLDDDASPRNIGQALRTAIADSSEDDTLLFYFAGHGVSRNGDFLLCTGDTDEIHGMPGKDLDALLSTFPGRGVLIMLDCCGGAALAENAPNFFRNLDGSDYRILISASRSGQSSWEAEGYGSLFTTRLLQSLRGLTEAIDRGRIYFHDLFAYLRTSVVQDAKSKLAPGILQEPVFTGVYSEEPLLFLHRDATLDEVRVRTKRVTREDLSRRVRLVAAGLIAAMMLSLGGYWTFLDQHHYLSIDGDRVSLFHGYPNMSGFGYPKKNWTYEFGLSNLAEASPLLNGDPLIMARTVNPSSVLRNQLKPIYQIQLDKWRETRDTAQDISPSLDIDATEIDDDALPILPSLVSKADVAWLEDAARNAPFDRADDFTQALYAVSPEKAAELVADRTATAPRATPYVYWVSWSGPCTHAMEDALASFTEAANASYFFRNLALAYVRSGCPLPPDIAVSLREASIFMEDDKELTELQNAEAELQVFRQAAIVLRVSNPAEIAPVRNGFDISIQKLGPGNVFDRHRHLIYLNELGNPPCPLGRPEMLPTGLSPDQHAARLEYFKIALQACEGVTLSSTVFRQLATLELRKDGETIATVQAARAPRMIMLLIEMAELAASYGSTGDDLYDLILGPDLNEELLVLTMKQARRAGLESDPWLPYIPRNRPHDFAHAMRWMAQHDQDRAIDTTLIRISETAPSSALLELAYMVGLDDTERRQVLAVVKGYDLPLRAVGQALFFDPGDAAKLLFAPNPEIRRLASDYLPARQDWDAVYQAARGLNQRYDDGAFSRALAHKADIDQTVQLLENLEPYGRPWLANELDTFSITTPGHALALRIAAEAMGVVY